MPEHFNTNHCIMPCFAFLNMKFYMMGLEMPLNLYYRNSIDDRRLKPAKATRKMMPIPGLPCVFKKKQRL